MRSVLTAWMMALVLLPATAWGIQEPKPEVRSNPNRPASADLLPEGTVVYLQIHNVREFVARMEDTSVGKAMANEKLAVLVDKLYGEVKNQYEKVRDQVGVSLDELTQLLTGELCFAVVAYKDRSPGVVLMFDYDPEAETLSTLLQTGRTLAENDGATFETTAEGDIEIETVHGNNMDLFFFDSEGTFVASTDLELSKELLARWRGEDVAKVRPLSQNRKFVTIMNRCRGTKDAPPELRGYIDPIDLAKALTRGNFGARVVINSLQIVGLDGFLAAGGSVIYGEDGYESITHGHVLMANPRAGVLAMTELAPGNLDPEPWVPDDTISYISWNWDVERMYAELGKIIDAFQGEGAFEKLVEGTVNKEIELNLHDDILATLGGRITYATWYQKPVTFNSQTNAIAFEIKDQERFQQSLEHLMEKALSDINERRDEPLEPRDDYRGFPCWKFDQFGRNRGRGDDESEDEDEDSRIRRASVRQAFPNLALTDGFLILSDSRAFIEKAIDTQLDESARLKDDEQFVRVSRHMQRLLGTSVPGAIIFSRPERSLEMIYDMAKSEATGHFLARGAEENEVVGAFKRILDENPLPDFDELRPFFAPAGMYVTSDETGVHVLGFQLRSDDER